MVKLPEPTVFETEEPETVPSNAEERTAAMMDQKKAAVDLQAAQAKNTGKNIQDTSAMYMTQLRNQQAVDEARAREQQAKDAISSARGGKEQRKLQRAADAATQAREAAERQQAAQAPKEPTDDAAIARAEAYKNAQTMDKSQQNALGINKLMDASKAQATAAANLLKAESSGTAEEIKAAQQQLDAATQAAVQEAQSVIEKATGEYQKLETEINQLKQMTQEGSMFGLDETGAYNKDVAIEQFASAMGLGTVDHTKSKKEQADQIFALRKQAEEKGLR